ncbi:MAG: TonB-dependent receptor [Opitutaceae bacterium]|jgi:TonB-dependent receptor|nr:TonB-dependent receptor [Opitutaceae bacterium]
MKHPIPELLLLAALALAAPATASFADGDDAAAPGQITGVVINRDTRTALQGARVEIPALRLSTLTDETGRYTLLAVPPGGHRLWISYMGLDDQTAPVQVAPGERASRDIALTAEIYKMERFVVTGEREGQAAAITRQRNADNMKNVLAMDAFGLLPNNNVGELLIQVPGVVGDLDDEGNITSVSVRGMASYTTSFTLDGNSLAGTGEERTFNTRDISAGLFDEIEIIKASTPENEGNSLGGSVNLKSLSTLRNRGRVFTYRVSGVWAPSFADQIPLVTKNQALSAKLNLSYRDIFSVLGGKNNLGVSLSLIRDESFKGYYSNAYVYEYTTDSPAFIWNYTATDTYSKRINQSARLRFDLKLSPSFTVYASAMLNDAIQPRNESYAANLNGAVTGFDAAWTDAGYEPAHIVHFGNIVPGYTDDFTAIRLLSGSPDPGVSRVNWPRALATSTLTSSISRGRALNLGAIHEFSRLLADYDVNYNYNHTNLSDGVDRDGLGGQFRLQSRNRHTWSIDKSKSWAYPSVVSTNPSYNLEDPASYGTTQSYLGTLYKNDGMKQKNSFLNASANLRYIPPLPFASSIKAGVRHRRQKLDLRNGRQTYSLDGTDSEVAGGTVLQGFYNPSVDISSQYMGGLLMPFFDVARIARDVRDHPEHWAWSATEEEAEYNRRTKNVTETVNAAYVQGTAKIGRLGMLAGVRFERTETESFAYVPTFNLSGSQNWNNVNATTANKTYDNWFPSAHLKYTLTPDLQLRASWSNTIGRPKFAELFPNYTYNTILNEGRVYNPGLKAQTSMNWDLSLEYYLKRVGQFSVGYFRKDIDDFLTSAKIDPPGWVLEDPAVDAGAIFLMPFNGRSAVINGVEISFQQNLTFLPGVLSGLSVYANYTHIDMSGDYGNENNSTDALERFVPNTANLTLTWKLGRLTASASANYTDEQLWTYGINKWDLIYKEGRLNLNARLLYQLARGVSLSCDVLNITEEPQRYYYFTRTRPQKYSNAGLSVIFGLSGRF